MKTLLLLFIVGICAIGLRSPEIMQAIGVAGSAQDPGVVAAAKLPDISVTKHRPMSVDQFVELSKIDPNAYQKYLNSHQMQGRTEVDRLMNFFTRGKYE